MLPDPLVALLVKHEGIRLDIYRDSSGHRTIGVGRNIDANPLPAGMTPPITTAQAFDLLNDDIAHAEDELTLNFPWFIPLDRVRQAALMDLIFNVGLNSLLGFSRFLDYMAQGNWNAAAGDLLSTLYARQVPTRATDLAHMILTGTWV